MIDTVIISDLHLGTNISRADTLLKTLNSYKVGDKYQFNRLILLGDIFEDLNFNRLNGHQWQLLSFFRKLSNPKHLIPVIWVLGNHDYKTLTTASHFLGIELFEEYIWTYANEKYLAIHGDQFDRFIINNTLLSKLAIKFFISSQRIPRLSRYIDRFSTKWLRLVDRMRIKALDYARKNKVEYVFCGHSHHAELIKGEITYGNTGSWVQIPSSYITIGDKGVELHFVP